MAARPKASEGRDTRKDLLDAALELFAEQGFHATSLRDIGRAVGVRESAIYHHFSGKEALFEAVLFDVEAESALRPLPPLTTLPRDARELEELLERSILAMMDRFATLKERKRFRIMLTEGLRLAASEKGFNYFEKMAPMRKPVIELFAALMDSGLVARRDPEATALALMSPLLLWRQLFEVSPNHTFVEHPKAFARQLVEQFLHGSLARPVRVPQAHEEPGHRHPVPCPPVRAAWID